MKQTIELIFFEESFRERICSYQLPEKQRDFTVLPSEALRRFENEYNSYCLLMLKEQEPIGFFVMQEGEIVERYYDKKKTMLIRSLSIRPDYQGQGIGTEIMNRLPAFVNRNFPHIMELFLLVNHRNKGAIRVYKKCGYKDRGIRVEGRAGKMLMLHYTFEKEDK